MKVLIVEDDEIQRMLLVELLKRFEQIEIVEAVDGDSAWAELEKGLCPVLCCCDVRMPGISGIELLQRLKTRPALANMPVIFVTAAMDRETIQSAIANGATNYILKPFNINKAQTALERAFRGVRERYSETPQATQRRLRVTPDKLIAFYGALKGQLVAAHPLVAAQLQEGDTEGARTRLDGLKTGCNTLGLLHGAAMIEHLRALEAALVDRILLEVRAVVEEQTVRACGDFGIPVPKPAPASDPAAESVAAEG